MLPHFDGMVSPRPDPRARGAFLNLSLHHSCADMYRATLEALGYTFKECLELFQQSGFDIKSVRAIGGGAKSDVWVQMIADIVGLPVERPAVAEAAVLGAAMIAAVGAGEFASLEQSSEAFHQSGQTFSPRPENHAVYQELGEKFVRMCRHVYSRPA